MAISFLAQSKYVSIRRSPSICKKSNLQIRLQAYPNSWHSFANNEVARDNRQGVSASPVSCIRPNVYIGHLSQVACHFVANLREECAY